MSLDMAMLQHRLTRIEEMLLALIQREPLSDWYSVEEFARLVGRSPFTCRQWCRRGRIIGHKQASGRGAYRAWTISHDELLRYRRDGLLPSRRE